jgi:hypothetical protein
MPSARIGALAILCACGTSPWDPAIVDEGGDLPLDVELPFEIATIEGDDDDPLYGFASRLSAVGDFDADGFPDIAAVTQYEDVVVALGGGRPPSFVSDLRANDRGFVIVPETDDWFSIGDIEGAVDFDGDGDQDLVVGVEQVEIAPTHFVNRAYIVFGGARPAAPIRLADIAAGRGGVLLEGFGVAGVSGVGDLDGDGRDELALVGPPVLEQAPVWTAHILRGRDDTALLRQADFTDEVDGFVIRSADPALSLGRVDACGDVDGDGLDDLLVSGHLSIDGDTAQRVAFVVFGESTPRSIGLDPDQPEARSSMVEGSTTGSHPDYLGPPPQCGDFDGNGRADLLFGEALLGEAFVVLEIERGARLDLADVGGDVPGFRVRPVASGFGFAEVATPIGDLDGDGRTDLLVEMRTYDGETQRNWALFVLGREGHDPVDAADVIAGEGGFAFVETRTEQASSALQWAVAPGDFDGNGLLDVAISDVHFEGARGRGRVRLLLFDEPVSARATQVRG